jgi:hypothetical protein
VEVAEAHQAEVEAATRAATDATWAALREITRDVLDSGLRAEAITGLPRKILVRIVRTPAYPNELPSTAGRTLMLGVTGPKWSVRL